MSGVYWGLTAMDLMGQLQRMNKPEVLGFVTSCQNPCGGFGPTEHHDPHLLYTLSAIQVYIHHGNVYKVHNKTSFFQYFFLCHSFLYVHVRMHTMLVSVLCVCVV